MDTALILTRALHFAAVISLAGSFVFPVVVAEPAMRAGRTPRTGDDRLRRSLCGLAWISLALALLSGLLWLILEARGMSGLPLPAVFSQGIVAKVLAQTRFGQVWLLRFALALLLALILVARDRRGPDQSAGPIGLIALPLSAAMLAALAWAGHAGATLGAEGDVHVTADALHLLAAGTWLGALYPLARLFTVAMREAGWTDVARIATRRFSRLGIVSVATLLATGMVNGWFLVGGIPGLLGTPYGQILLVKLALFVAMVAIAAVNRQRLTPRLLAPGAPLSVLRALRRNALLETVLGLAIVGLVGALGATPPALHVEPIWPLPFRIDLDALPLDRRTLLDGAMVGLGLVLLLRAGLGRRRHRASGLVGAALVLGFAWPLLSTSLVEAYPTTFYRMPVGYAAPSIARGATLYAQQCAACHGAGGRGDGPAAQGLATKPADLAAGHLFAHSSGDLFWWISRGRGNAMPGFAEVMDEGERWDVINFIRSRAAAQTLALSPEVTTQPAPLAPDFTFEQQGNQGTLRQAIERGPLLLVLYRLPMSLPRLQLLAADQSRLDAAGLRLLALPIGASPEDLEKSPALPDFAASTDADTAPAYAPLEGDGDVGHCEFLIDRAGFLRARWKIGEAGGVADSTTLLANLHRLVEMPLHQHEAHVHAH
jgi:putative copper export protein/mono/diheme cytochrome c family protein